MPSQSQASTLVNRGNRGSGGVFAPAGALARRRPASRSSGSNASSKQQATNFYTDDSPGWKMSPVVVMTMSLGFIAFVTVLHVVGKFASAA